MYCYLAVSAAVSVLKSADVAKESLKHVVIVLCNIIFKVAQLVYPAVV